MIPDEMTVTQFTRVIVHTINVFWQMEHLHGTNLTKTVVKVKYFFLLEAYENLNIPYKALRLRRVYKGCLVFVVRVRLINN